MKPLHHITQCDTPKWSPLEPNWASRFMLLQLCFSLISVTLALPHLRNGEERGSVGTTGTEERNLDAKAQGH